MDTLRLQELGKIKLQDSSGGNFDNFIHKEFSGRIPFCTTLAIDITLNKMLKISTTTILKHDFWGHFSCGVPGAARDVSLVLCEENKKITLFVMNCYAFVWFAMLYHLLD